MKELIEELEQAKKDTENDQLFSYLVIKCLNQLHLSDADLASRFGMSRRSVRRWISGATSPHPLMRPQIYDAFIELLTIAIGP